MSYGSAKSLRADVVGWLCRYDELTADWLAECLANRLAPHGRVLLTQPIRQMVRFQLSGGL
eukprot:1040091-Pyramimonas_sp.AAC.1